jgi:hypothetical protein
MLAIIETASLIGTDRTLETVLGDQHLESGPNRGGTAIGTAPASVAGAALVHAHEDVSLIARPFDGRRVINSLSTTHGHAS